MLHLFINGLAASAGGGLTYLRNVIPQLSAHGDVRATVALQPDLAREFPDLRNISLLQMQTPAGAARRFWHEQTVLPDLIRRAGADLLLSAGNFALRRSPVPQILLSRNSLYTSQDFYRDLRQRHEYRMWVETRIRGVLARRSIRWADRTVAPSHAFAETLRRWTGRDITVVHHGFDRKGFFQEGVALPADLQSKLDGCKHYLKLLFVSHYNYYRNFETLFRALPLLKSRLPQPKLKLLLTCRFRAEDTPGSYRPEAAAALLASLGVAEDVVELGAVPYHLLQHIYRAADIYVTPAYAETFAHPLVEAMASGLPVVASDIPVHREICGTASVYFDAFSPERLAAQVAQIAASSELRERLVKEGLQRSTEFSWTQHVEQMLSLARELAAGGKERAARTG